MQIAESLDTGDILLQQKLPIEATDDALTLQKKLFNVGAELLLKAVEQIKNKSIKRIPQKEKEASYAELIRKEFGEIDWRKPAQEIFNRIRALVPWPCAHTFFEEKMLKIWKAEPVELFKKAKPGEVVDTKDLTVACGSGGLKIQELQLEGKRRLRSEEFLNGHKVSVGDILPS
jgi:methionyl-tRNA formyltransferase